MGEERPLKVWLVAAACTAALSAGLTACSGPGADTFGQELYEQSCAVCHGANGEGSAGRPALGAGSNAVELSDDQLRGAINVGPGAMPSFEGKLSAAQVDSLVQYLRELQEQPTESE